jgi:hypothetical protein
MEPKEHFKTQEIVNEFSIQLYIYDMEKTLTILNIMPFAVCESPFAYVGRPFAVCKSSPAGVGRPFAISENFPDRRRPVFAVCRS